VWETDEVYTFFLYEEEQNDMERMWFPMENKEKGRLLFIYNPVAGKGKIKAKLSEILEQFSAAGYELIVHPTNSQGDARRTALKYAKEHRCERIVCVGGDGTFSETAGGVLLSGERLPLGYVPEGTTNDFAYSLKLPTDMNRAAELAAHGSGIPSDIGTMNGEPFTYTACFGLFTEVTYETPQSIKNAIGRTAYLMNGASKLMNIKSYPMKVQGENFLIEDEFIYGMVANSNSVGGFKGITGRDVALDDGFFEMILIKKPKNLIEFNEIVNALLSNHLDHCANIRYERVNRVTITTEHELPWNLDGEFGGNLKSAEIIIHKQKIDYVTAVLNPGNSLP